MSHFYTQQGDCIEGLRAARKLSPLPMPSPTTVLKLIKGEGLIEYFKRQVFQATATTPRLPDWTDEQYYEQVTRWADEHSKNARTAGGDLHNVIQRFHMSCIGEGPIDLLIPEHFADQYDLYLRWYEKYVAKSLMVEQVVFGDGYAGRVDHVALLRDGRVAVCDVKTQDISKRNRFAQYPEHFLQLGAYAGTILPRPQVLINIYLSSKPPFVLESYTWPGSPELGHELFLNVLRLWQFINNYQFQEMSPASPLDGSRPFEMLGSTPSAALSGSANASAATPLSAPDANS